MIWRRKPSISADLRDWIVDSFDWTDTTFGTTWHLSRLLITPTKTFFSAPSGQTPEVAQIIADDIAKQIPVPSIPVSPINNLPPEYRQQYGNLSDIGGLYIEDEDGPQIMYNAETMRAPAAFINTMTHELMHNRIGPYASVMPGGIEAHELATDLHCITHGFGIFALEGPAAIGWSGYMTRESRAFALALFLQRHSMDPDEAAKFLDPRNKKALKRALSEVKG